MRFDSAAIINKMIEAGIIDRNLLHRVRLTCKNRNISVPRVLANYANLTSADIQAFFSEYFDLEIIHLDTLVLNPKVAGQIPYDIAAGHNLIPAFKIRANTYVAVGNPLDLDGIRLALNYIGENNIIFLSPENEIIDALRKLKSNDRSARPS